jgi:hypothetical protein
MTGSIEHDARRLIAASGAVNLHPKKATKAFHADTLDRHTNTSITPHGCGMLCVHLTLVDWHIQCLRRLYKLGWEMISQASN